MSVNYTKKSNFLFVTVDGGWTEWQELSSCSVTCGEGIIYRERTCTNPPTQYGGLECQGPAESALTCTQTVSKPRESDYKVVVPSMSPYGDTL